MKVFILALLLFAVICGGVICNSIYLGTQLLDLRDTLVSIPIPSENESDLSFQGSSVFAVQENWYHRVPLFSLTISHQDLMEVETKFAATLGAAASGSRDTYLVSLAELEYALTHLAKMSRMSLQSVL